MILLQNTIHHITPYHNTLYNIRQQKIPNYTPQCHTYFTTQSHCHTRKNNTAPTTQHYIIPHNTTQYYTIPQNTIQYYTIPQNTTQYYTIPQNTTQYYTIPHNTTQYYTTGHNTTQQDLVFSVKLLLK